MGRHAAPSPSAKTTNTACSPAPQVSAPVARRLHLLPCHKTQPAGGPPSCAHASQHPNTAHLPGVLPGCSSTSCYTHLQSGQMGQGTAHIETRGAPLHVLVATLRPASARDWEHGPGLSRAHIHANIPYIWYKDHTASSVSLLASMQPVWCRPATARRRAAQHGTGRDWGSTSQQHVWGTVSRESV